MELISTNKTKEQISYNMPDDTITIANMKNYGYTWDGMFPMRKKVAYKVVEFCDIYRLYSDDSEGMVENVEEIRKHANNGGIFGVEKDMWLCFKNRYVGA